MSKKDFKSLLLGDEFQTLTPSKALNIFRLAMAEFLGTAIFVGLGCMGLGSNTGKELTHLEGVFTFAMAVATAIMIIGHVSGSHINPALSLVAVVMSKLSLQLYVVYVLAQLAGATFGYSITRSLFRSESLSDTFCCTFPKPNVEISQAFLAELVLTAIVSMVLCAAYDRRILDKHDSMPIKFGFAIVALAVPGAQFAGASLNPARSFGPALITGNWEHHWLYWVAPLSGAFIGSVIYRVLFYDNPDETDEKLYDVNESINLRNKQEP